MASIENPYCYIVTKLQSYKTDFQHILCLVADGHTMVGTQTYSPHDNSLSINDYQLTSLLENIHLQVGHQVAQQLAAFHTVGHHPVTLLYPADGQRKGYFVGIERSNIGVFRYVNSTFSHPNLPIFVQNIRSFLRHDDTFRAHRYYASMGLKRNIRFFNDETSTILQNVKTLFGMYDSTAIGI